MFELVYLVGTIHRIAQQANILSKYTINGLNDLFADIEMNKDKRKGYAVVRRNLRFEHNWSSNRSNHTEFKTTVRSSMLFEQRFCSNSSFVQIMVYQWERIFYYLSFTDWSYVSSKYRFAIDQPRLGTALISAVGFIRHCRKYI